MGRVFTFDEIQTDTIPRRRDFPVLVDIIRDELGQSLIVPGAVIYGSVLRGDYSIRSDVDVLMLYEPGREGEIVDLQQWLQDKAKSLAIPLQLIAVDADMAKAGDHRLPPMCLEHLGRAASHGFIKKNPLDYIQPLPITYHRDLQQYLTGKRDAFNHALGCLRVMSEERRADVLGKALSFPVYVARKMLQYANPTVFEDDRGDGKALVLSHYPSLGIDCSSEILAQMQQLNVTYDVALSHQRDTLNRRSYEMSLLLLECALYLAFEFAKINLVALRTLKQG